MPILSSNTGHNTDAELIEDVLDEVFNMADKGENHARWLTQYLDPHEATRVALRNTELAQELDRYVGIAKPNYAQTYVQLHDEYRQSSDQDAPPDYASGDTLMELLAWALEHQKNETITKIKQRVASEGLIIFPTTAKETENDMHDPTQIFTFSSGKILEDPKYSRKISENPQVHSMAHFRCQPGERFIIPDEKIVYQSHEYPAIRNALKATQEQVLEVWNLLTAKKAKSHGYASLNRARGFVEGYKKGMHYAFAEVLELKYFNGQTLSEIFRMPNVPSLRAHNDTPHAKGNWVVTREEKDALRIGKNTLGFDWHIYLHDLKEIHERMLALLNDVEDDLD